VKTALVTGLGIGGMYAEELLNAGYAVDTVDADVSKNAQWSSVDAALAQGTHYDLATISTPNFTHVDLANKIAAQCGIVFVDKPGAENCQAWKELLAQHGNTRIVMIKNNQWRSEVAEWQQLIAHTRTLRINWINRNRVPKPGSWFTNKKLSYGGVSRDLMPHLLSIMSAVYPQAPQAHIVSQYAEQRWRLADLVDSDYGAVDQSGVYDVDDFATVEFMHNGRRFVLTADWRSMHTDDISISFELEDSSVQRYQLGLCPASVYADMFTHCELNLHNQEFWNKQYATDVWIHGILDAFK
jgi:predicted dehydrogenase